MLHAEFQRQGYDLGSVVGLADQEAIEYMLRVSGFIWKKYKAIDSLAPSDWGQLQAVTLKAGVDGTLACIDKLVEASRLVYLGIPVASLASALPKIAQLSSLRYLDISGEGSGGIQGVLLDQIRSLEGIEAKLKVDAACVPRLQHLHIADKPKGMMAKLVRGLPLLDSLTLCPYGDKLAQEMELNALRYANLIDGQDETISAITRFQGLTNVHVQNVGRITSIGPLLELPALRELSLGYCNRIRDIERLAEVPCLERLHIYACKIDLKELERRLDGRLLELRI